MVPLYLKYMGAEAYGLVGFFTMLLSWLQLMDMGLTPTLSRELSRFRAGALSALEVCTLVRSLEWLFGILAVICVVASLLGSSWIAVYWLKVQKLGINEVANCIAIMGGIGGLRWLTGIYRSGLIGLDRQFSVNGISVVIATLRSVVVLGILIYWSPSPLVFFSYQAVIAVVECITFRQVLYSAIPSVQMPVLPDWSSLNKISGFAGSIAFTAGIWVVIMQLDKLILSHYLTLKDYGYFSLAASVANGIILLSAPLNQALQPRLTILASQGQEVEFIKLYRTATQLSAVIMVTLGGILSSFSEQLLLAWTGKHEIATHAAPILFWYAMGNAVVGLLSLPYLLQYARGYLRLHVIGNILFMLLWIPAIIFSSSRYGGVGAGVTWFVGNLGFMLIWVTYVHQRLAPSIVFAWFFRDIFMVVIAPIAVLTALSITAPDLHSRLIAASYLVLCGIIVLVVAALFASDVRKISFRLIGIK